MLKELILVRHGKAEDISDSGLDDDRVLTSKGELQLKAALPSLEILIKPGKDMQIWSSPMRRAAQTAKIMAVRMGIEHVAHFDFIGDGDFSLLAAELAKIEACRYLIIVGHQPYLSDWSERVGGCRLPFDKASAASFRLSAISPPTGQLQWFLQAKTMRYLASKLG